jgi:hypothetical protein
MADAPKKATKKNKYPNSDEGRAARFRDVAKSRTVKAVKAIRLLRNLRGPNYASTPEQIATIEGVISGEVKAAFEVLRAPKGTVKEDINIDI